MTGPKIMQNGKVLSEQEVADWANKVHKFVGGKGEPFNKEMFIPHDGPVDRYRLGGYHCDCGCDEDAIGKPSNGEFELLPLSDPSIREGEKAYMVCTKCGAYSHL